MERTIGAARPQTRSAPLGEQAVVIGGSLAGLLTARVLSDHFQQVQIIERDLLADEVAPHQGVPQGRHAHGLLGMGQQILGRYFPGLFEELQQQGATRVDLGYDVGWYQAGGWWKRVPTGMIASVQSRPLLETAVRRRVQRLPNVHFVTNCAATGLAMNAARTHITGVRIQHRDTPAQEETVPATLVVDAGGRGSRLSHWLVAQGYPPVEEVEVKMGMGYTTRFYRRPAGFNPGWKMLLIIPQPPETRMGLLIPMEGDGWMVSLCGWHHDHAPLDDAGFLEFARSLPVPDLYEAIKEAEPLTPIVVHRIPSNLWRRYDRMARFPEGLVALGDGLCSFNPTYGQGMTTAALYVNLLETCLRAQDRTAPNVRGLADRFRRRVAAVVATPWLLATVEDFRYAQTEGKHPLPTPFLHWYLDKLYTAAAHDGRLVAQFLQVMNMFRSPPALFLPHIALRVLSARFRYKPATGRSAPRAEHALPAPKP